MTKKVLILGGQGRIGKSVALDLATHNDFEITVTGRQKKQNLDEGLKFLALDLKDTLALQKAISESDANYLNYKNRITSCQKGGR